MKRKRTNWDLVKWTPFVQAPVQRDHPAYLGTDHIPFAIYVNSRYQVSMFNGGEGAPFGRVLHLSIKTHDRSARHDWRDMQRIKNELVGPEHDAVEIYPAESKLVDGANQYHLWVFDPATFTIPFGFHHRMVADGAFMQSKQRPWSADDRPADCMNTEQYAAFLDRVRASYVSKNSPMDAAANTHVVEAQAPSSDGGGAAASDEISAAECGDPVVAGNGE